MAGVRMLTVPHLATLAGASLLLIYPADPRVALYGMLITTVAGLVKSWMDRKTDLAKAEQKHEFEMEEKREIARLLAENTAITKQTAAVSTALIMGAVAENTDLTKSGIQKVE